MAYVHYADDVRIENRYPHMDRDEIKCGFDKARRIFNKYVWWYLITPDSDKGLQDIRRVSAQEVNLDMINGKEGWVREQLLGGSLSV